MLFRLSINYVNFVWTQEHIGIFVIIHNPTIFDILPLPQHPIDNRKGCTQEIFLRYDGDNLKSINKRFNKNISEQKDGVGENMRIITDKDNPIFKHH